MSNGLFGLILIGLSICMIIWRAIWPPQGRRDGAGEGVFSWSDDGGGCGGGGCGGGCGG